MTVDNSLACGHFRFRWHRILVSIAVLVVLCLPAAANAFNPGARLAAVVATEDAAKDQKPNGWKIFFVLAAVFAVSLTAGGAYGAFRSPSFDNRTDIARFVAANAKSKVMHAKGFSADGKLTVMRNEFIRFPTGIVTWVYDAANPKPVRASFDPQLDGALPSSKKKLNYAQSLAAIAIVGPVPTALQASGQVGDMVKTATGPDKAKLIFGLLFAAGTGFALGYKLAYVEKPDLQSKAFDEQLNDPIFWESVQKLRHGQGTGGWKYYESAGSILVERLADGTVLLPIPIETIIALQQVGENSLASRLCKQEGITFLRPGLG